MIPVCEPLLVGNEEKYVLDCIRSGWVSSAGRYVEEFEQQFAEYCGCRYGVSTTSGTTALHLALVSLGIGKEDEVIVPTLTNAACVFAVLYTGATPVFIDCEPAAYTMDAWLLESLVTSHTKAVMPVHLYGHPCDMDRVNEVAKRHDLDVIEDAAEAHGALYKGKKVGDFSDVACFSFYANKVMTTGEGGMVVTSDRAVCDRARRLKDLAHDPKRRFYHTDIGFNYRMTNIQAAIGLAQLEKIDEYVGMRRANAASYTARLAKSCDVTTPVEMWDSLSSYWMYAILVKDKTTRDGLRRHLEEKEIGTRTFFIPMHQQGIFREYSKGKFPVADNASARGLYLPSGTGLTNEEIETVCDAVEEYLK